jgi:hypothetical protein
MTAEHDFFVRMQQKMDEQATDVWDMVRYSRSPGYRLRLGEVTTTELNFFRLREFWTKRVYIVTDEPDETTTGADWEWIIGHGDQWIQIRVQAKIINANGSFAELGHPRATGEQMRRLLDPARESVACRWLPLYVFYASENVAKTPVGRDAGCSAQLAWVVKENYGKPPRRAGRLRALDHLPAQSTLPGAIPWSHIFNGLVNRLQAGESLDAIVGSLANASLPPVVKNIGDFWDPRVTAGLCVAELPAYIRAIVTRDDDDFDDAPLTELRVATPASRRAEARRASREAEGEPRVRHEVREENREDSPVPLPSRTLLIDRDDTRESVASLPSFVSVLDIDRLPPLPERG